MTLPQTFFYMPFRKNMYIFLWSMNVEVKSLGPEACICSALVCSIVFSKELEQLAFSPVVSKISSSPHPYLHLRISSYFPHSGECIFVSHVVSISPSNDI